MLVIVCDNDNLNYLKQDIMVVMYGFPSRMGGYHVHVPMLHQHAYSVFVSNGFTLGIILLANARCWIFTTFLNARYNGTLWRKPSNMSYYFMPLTYFMLPSILVERYFINLTCMLV